MLIWSGEQVGSCAGLKGVEQQGNSLELCTEATDFC